MAVRQRRTYAQLFIAKLQELSGGEQQLIGNVTLRGELGWDEDRYERVKTQLYGENLIILGRGRGGSVGLADAPGSKALSVFISYSHADEVLKNELLKHLEPLKRLNLIEAWNDRQLQAGDKWEQEISDNLEEADIILILVSIDFINSKYCYDVEMERALERHAEGSAVVVPVILRPCLWKHTPFAKLQGLPRDAKAVSTWADRDEAMTNIVEALREIAERLRATEEAG
jgi:hypothetical protein